LFAEEGVSGNCEVNLVNLNISSSETAPKISIFCNISKKTTFYLFIKSLEPFCDTSFLIFVVVVVVVVVVGVGILEDLRKSKEREGLT
jgi:hypothetical protein